MAVKLLAALPEIELGTVDGGVWSNFTGVHHTGYSRAQVYSDGNNGLGSVRSKQFAGGVKTTFGAMFRLDVTFDWNDTNNAGLPIFMFCDSSGVPIIGIGKTNTNPKGHLVLLKYESSTWSVLYNTGIIPDKAYWRFDILVEDYGTVDARVRVWLSTDAGVYILPIDYSDSDINVSGCSGAECFRVYNAFYHAGFECTAAFDGNPVRCDLVTQYPNAAGPTPSFDSGTYATIANPAVNINVHADSGTAGQELIVNLSNLPSGIGNSRIVGVETCVTASRGTTGPQSLQTGLRSDSTTAYETAASLEEAPTNVIQHYDVNPVTASEFTMTEVDALQLAIKSAT